MDFRQAFIILIGVAGVWGSCDDPPAISNTANNLVGSAPFPEGTSVTYTCNIGYREDGYSNAYTCNGGSWTGGPYQCVEILCLFLDPPRNGRLDNSPTYKINSIIKFACNNGYDMSGKASARCNIDGWVPLSYTPPKCTPKDCGEFGDILNGHTFQESPDGVYNDFGSSVVVSCEDGYTLSGVAKVYCEASGSWGSKPSCVRLTCPDYPGLNFSKCIKTSHVSNSMLYMYCIDDQDMHTKVGRDDYTVCIEGKWHDLTLRCYCNCQCQSDLPNVVFDNCNAKGYLAHGSTLSWRCKAGSHRDPGSQSISCTDGVFGGEPVCVLDPTPPKPSPTKPAPPDANATTTKPLEPEPNPKPRVLIIVIGGLFGVGALVAAIVVAIYRWKKSQDPMTNEPETEKEEAKDPENIPLNSEKMTNEPETEKEEAKDPENIPLNSEKMTNEPETEKEEAKDPENIP